MNRQKRSEYALLETEIIKVDNTNQSIILEVNSNGFLIDPKTLREFFEIEYQANLHDILKQFNKYFSSFIPSAVDLKKSKQLEGAIISSLSKSDGEDPRKIYCFTVKRNPLNQRRSVFNDNKTKLLRPALHSKFKDEITISFCYSKHLIKEESDNEILMKFSRKNK